MLISENQLRQLVTEATIEVVDQKILISEGVELRPLREAAAPEQVAQKASEFFSDPLAKELLELLGDSYLGAPLVREMIRRLQAMGVEVPSWASGMLQEAVDPVTMAYTSPTPAPAPAPAAAPGFFARARDAGSAALGGVRDRLGPIVTGGLDRFRRTSGGKKVMLVLVALITLLGIGYSAISWLFGGDDDAPVEEPVEPMPGDGGGPRPAPTRPTPTPTPRPVPAPRDTPSPDSPATPGQVPGGTPRTMPTDPDTPDSEMAGLVGFDILTTQGGRDRFIKLTARRRGPNPDGVYKRDIRTLADVDSMINPSWIYKRNWFEQSLGSRPFANDRANRLWRTIINRDGPIRGSVMRQRIKRGQIGSGGPLEERRKTKVTKSQLESIVYEEVMKIVKQ